MLLNEGLQKLDAKSGWGGDDGGGGGGGGGGGDGVRPSARISVVPEESFGFTLDEMRGQ